MAREKKQETFISLLSRKTEEGEIQGSACLVEERLRDVADVPIGAACGDDHVVGAGTPVQPALPNGEDAHVARPDVAQHLLHLRELQQRRRLRPRGRSAGGGGGEEAWEEVRRRSPPANGTRSHGGEHRRRRQGFRWPFLFPFLSLPRNSSSADLTCIKFTLRKFQKKWLRKYSLRSLDKSTDLTFD